jgi:hypothetical protein
MTLTAKPFDFLTNKCRRRSHTFCLFGIKHNKLFSIEYLVGVQRNWEKIFNFQAHIQTPYD